MSSCYYSSLLLWHVQDVYGWELVTVLYFFFLLILFSNLLPSQNKGTKKKKKLASCALRKIFFLWISDILFCRNMFLCCHEQTYLTCIWNNSQKVLLWLFKGLASSIIYSSVNCCLLLWLTNIECLKCPGNVAFVTHVTWMISIYWV